MKVCRICLLKDGRLYHFTSNGLRSLYQQLFLGVIKLEVDEDKRLPQWVCAECGLRLMSYNKLRQKSFRAHQILTKLLDRGTNITEEDINQIDREKNNLQSNLTCTVLDNGNAQQQECVIHIEETDESNWKPKLKIEEIVINLEGSESSVFKNENDSDECNSETAVSNIDNNSDYDSDVLTDDSCLTSDSSSSVNKLLKTLSSSTLKTRSKKAQIDIKKQVDEYINTLNKKSTKKVKKEVKKEVKKVKSDVKKVKSDVKKVKSDVKKVKKDVKRVKKEAKTTRRVKKEGANKKGGTDPCPIDDVFTIQALSAEEQISEFEKKKSSKNYLEAPFKCDDCFNGFISEITLARHKIVHSDEWGKIECKICKRRFRSMRRYCAHMKSHKTIYSCKECQFITNTRAIATAHRLKHKGKIYSCAHCDLEFVNQSSYMSHLRIKHVSKFVCEFCGYSFVSAKGVHCHKILKHSHDKNNKIVSTDGPSCAPCNIKFVSDEALKTHIRVSHSKISDYKERNSDERHRRGKRSIICELCGVKSASGRAYTGHFRRFHPNENPSDYQTVNKPYMCEQCGRVFQSQANLVLHAVVHTEQRPFECDYCNKKFKSKLGVQIHISNVHLPKKLKVYPCGICGKEFSQHGNRKRHLAVHSDLRPFHCEVCGSTFKSKAEVKSHTTHVHMKVPWPRKKETLVRQWF